MSEFYQWIKFNRSRPLKETMPILKRKLMGFQNYFGLPDNSRSLSRLSHYISRSLYKWLNRRSQRRSYNWSSFTDMLGYFKIEPLKVSKRSIRIDWYWAARCGRWRGLCGGAARELCSRAPRWSMNAQTKACVQLQRNTVSWFTCGKTRNGDVNLIYGALQALIYWATMRCIW